MCIMPVKLQMSVMFTHKNSSQKVINYTNAMLRSISNIRLKDKVKINKLERKQKFEEYVIKKLQGT